jgi:hypothetical protein
MLISTSLTWVVAATQGSGYPSKEQRVELSAEFIPTLTQNSLLKEGNCIGLKHITKCALASSEYQGTGGQKYKW